MNVEFFEHPFRAATGRKRYQHWTALVSLHAPFSSARFCGCTYASITLSRTLDDEDKRPHIHYSREDTVRNHL
jgi:predicted adenine nucleotide alpha hydrolase (AANH) superfamily ATPase